MIDILTILSENPELLLVAGVLLRCGLAYQRELTWSEYRTAHSIKRGIFPILAKFNPPVSLINEKGGENDAEFLRTENRGVKSVARDLRKAGGVLHLICSVKERPDNKGDRYSAAHVVFLHDDDTQTETYVFRNSDGTTDVYVHHEPDPSRIFAHLGGDNQSDGDIRGVVTEALSPSS